MDLIIFSSYFLLLSILLYWKAKRFFTEFNPLTLLGLFGIKFLFALFFLYIYTYYYGGGELTADAGKFFNESSILYHVFQEDPKAYLSFLTGIGETPELINTYLDEMSHWVTSHSVLPNDSRNVIRINSLLFFISNGALLVHFLIFSFLSFIGGLDLYQFLKKHSSLPSLLILLATTLTPSIAFWGSSIIKEPLLILGLCLLIRGLFDTISWRRRWWRILLGSLLMLLFKPYILVGFIAGYVFFILIHYIIQQKKILTLAIYSIVVLLILEFSGQLDRLVHAISIQQRDFINLRDGGIYLIEEGDDENFLYIFPNYKNNFSYEEGYAILKHPTSALIRHRQGYGGVPKNLTEVGEKWKVHISLSQAGSGVDVTRIDGSFQTMLTMIPEILFITLVRPLPHDQGSWLKYPAFIENIFLLILLGLSFWGLSKSSTRLEQDLIYFLFIFALYVLLITGWTTPVLGAVVRYKVPATLALVIIILIKLKLPAKLGASKD